MTLQNDGFSPFFFFFFGQLKRHTRASLVAQTVKNWPAMQETWFQPLGQKDPLEKRMGFRSSILAWRIPWTEEPGGLQSISLQRVGHDWATFTHSWGTHSWSFFHHSNLLQMPEDHKMVNIEFFWWSSQLTTYSGLPSYTSSSSLSSPLQNPLNHRYTVYSLATPGPNALFMVWVISTALRPILNLNKMIA